MRVFGDADVGDGDEFPFLFGGTFIEGSAPPARCGGRARYFPSFSEGLSLREHRAHSALPCRPISLPFRRDFH